jgi:hypothetical protein
MVTEGRTAGSGDAAQVGALISSSTTLNGLAREAAVACGAEGLAIPIVTVAYGDEADQEALERIAGACQGRALTATPDDIVEVFERIGLLF